MAQAMSLAGFIGFSEAALSFQHDVLDGRNSIGVSLKSDIITNLSPNSFICLAWCAVTTAGPTHR
jgi:hypothetical protein